VWRTEGSQAVPVVWCGSCRGHQLSSRGFGLVLVARREAKLKELRDEIM
jgi:NADP-dependent 3-hydroxy acid dehydrogenase YdfG